MENSEKLIKKIMKDTHAGRGEATLVYGRLGVICPELQPCLAAWKKDRMLEFSYQNITLQEIMEKEEVCYLDAIFRMNVLMKRPDLAEKYKGMIFIRK